MSSGMKYEDGNIVVDVGHIFDYIDDEQAAALVQHLSCFEGVFRSCMDQVMTGCTEDGSYLDSATLNEYRAKISEGVDDARRQLVRRLLHNVSEAEDEAERCVRWACELVSKWPVEHWQSRPRKPDFMLSMWPTDAEVEAALTPKEAPDE